MNITRITCYSYCLPLRKPLRVPGMILEERHGLLFEVATDAGCCGWGEAAPLPGYASVGTDTIQGAAREMTQSMQGASLMSARKYFDNHIIAGALFFAMDTAARRIESVAAGVLPHQIHDRNAPRHIPLCALLDGDASEVRAHAVRAAEAGFRTVKIKVGRSASVDEDIGLVHEVRRITGGACRIRLDANRAWNTEQALRFCEAVAGDDMDYIEEPCISCLDFPAISSQTGIPYAVDETLREYESLLHGRQETIGHRACIEQAHALVWKPSLGLPPRALDIRNTAPVVISGCYESGSGTAALLEYAAVFRQGNWSAGIDTYSRLADDVLASRLPLDGPEADMNAVAAALNTLDRKKLNELWHE